MVTILSPSQTRSMLEVTEFLSYLIKNSPMFPINSPHMEELDSIIKANDTLRKFLIGKIDISKFNTGVSK